ncbi:hypothetical protein [Conexibacter sp. CPCC 206217]|nr:hypothetical protein [Conexibacter sp. CPCC 206217]MDO8213897.1 hypothetical protein [Conexibacter sp. CPCC 206217]
MLYRVFWRLMGCIVGGALTIRATIDIANGSVPGLRQLEAIITLIEKL